MIRLPAIIVLVGILIGVAIRRDAPRINPKNIKFENKYITLSDSRILEYTECGKEDGVPIISVPGFMCCAGSYANIDTFCKIFEKHNLRLIEMSLPGFGSSDSLPISTPRKLVDFPKDIKELLEHTVPNYTKSGFYVMGTSAGGVHAAIVGAEFNEYILGVLLQTPTMPSDKEHEEKDLKIHPITKFLRYSLSMPFVGDLLSIALWQMSVAQRREGAPDISMAHKKMLKSGGVLQDIAEQSDKILDYCGKHHYRGFVDNLVVLNSPWNFDYKNKLSKVNVLITSSNDDTTNPPQHQHWVHRNIPNSRIKVFPDGFGHLFTLVPEVLDESLADLIKHNTK